MSDLLERLAAENPVAVDETPRIDAVWAAIDAHQTADTRALGARRRVRRSFAAVITGALAAVVVVIAVVAVSALRARKDAAASSSTATPSLISKLGVLRRAQTVVDDPPAVIAFAQRTVTAHGTGPNPRAGTVVRALVRRLVVTPNGDRLFLAPVRVHRSGRIDLAALVLTDAHDRPLTAFPAQSVTSESIVQGAQSSGYGLAKLRSLLAQVVPDGVASVQFTFLVVPPPFARGQAQMRSITIAVHSNVAIALLTTPFGYAWPVKIIHRNSAHAIVSIASTLSTGNGTELNPATICAGIPRNRATNTQLPRSSSSSLPSALIHVAVPTRQSMCRQNGPPLRAYRQADGLTELLYPGDTLMLIAAHTNTIGTITHLIAGEPFPVKIPTTLPPAPDLTP